MNVVSFNKSRWRKKTPNRSLFFSISLILLVFFFCLISYAGGPFSVPTSSNKTLKSQLPHCSRETIGENFLWFAPHSGFNNQLAELKNAILVAAILNRTLIVPPILDHHSVVLGSCPKFRVLDPKELRMAVWNHIIELLQSRRYVSMGDIVDLASLGPSSTVKTIDFRVFASLWCGMKVDLSCFDVLKEGDPFLENLRKCGSLLSGMDGNVDNCIYALDEDCRTTVWTYNENDENKLDSFQPDEHLRKKKKISYIRRRRDVYKTLGPGSEAASATVLAFGSLFTAPYKGSQLYIDIDEVPRDHRIQSLLQKIEFLPFVPEIMNAGKKFVVERIKAPFLCAQLRLLDGQFKNHQKATFSGLKQKVESLRQNNPLPIHIFVMTDLPEVNWTGSYLGDLARDSDSYRLYNLQTGSELVQQTAEKLMAAGHGVRSGILASLGGRSSMKNKCPRGISPDILLYIEETICSCASLGFIGTAGSTIAENIQLMRKNGICSESGSS
ncbi:O-fucosyltransferase 30 [Macadamia integrifolia]|uniref:O-fucosyltransferase 30 n=1 Tax=Macadamia integrifolia TaxID=60698 RepID=UPI001C4FC582|nr:O-fucosyltransferase 30 [Macadamia integrifolia]